MCDGEGTGTAPKSKVNLALYLLDEDDVKGAESMLAPLADATRLGVTKMSFERH
jgi:hypothetical protein